MAPEMPTARYNFGVSLQLPICRSRGSHPLSQIGRDAASSARSALDELVDQWKILSCLFAMPRPTATMRSARLRSTACLASWNGGSGFWRIADASI